MQAFDRINLDQDGRMAILTLDHPDVMNAASARMMAQMLDALDAVSAGPCRALIVTGAGKAFCSGANLREAGADRDDFRAGETLEAVYHPVLRRLRDFPMPVVMAVNGPAVGIGMSLALMGDIILAARSAYFLQGFAQIGLVPDGGATWLLPRLIGLARARELALLSDRLTADTALEWGLINRVCDDGALMEDAKALAARLAAGPASLALTRRLLWDSAYHSHDAQLAAEQAAQAKAGATDDFREGIAAFFEKRAPHFRGS
jgi:2-(1,2-epoxy-1,2-dihydrophenyl)acetyl-CoA isomerase